MKCVNCLDEALYEYRVTEKKSLFYCGKDLPKFLESRRAAGNLTITSVFSETLISAIDALTTKVEVSVDPIAETPKKKAAKKKAE